MGPHTALRSLSGRVIDILKLAETDAQLSAWVDDARTVLAAEVAFAFREELARTLTDVVYRRMMLGLDADQGRALYDRLATIAALEMGWDAAERDVQLQSLISYSDSLGV